MQLSLDQLSQRIKYAVQWLKITKNIIHYECYSIGTGSSKSTRTRRKTKQVTWLTMIYFQAMFYADQLLTRVPVATQQVVMQELHSLDKPKSPPSLGPIATSKRLSSKVYWVCSTLDTLHACSSRHGDISDVIYAHCVTIFYHESRWATSVPVQWERKQKVSRIGPFCCWRRNNVTVVHAKR